MNVFGGPFIETNDKYCDLIISVMTVVTITQVFQTIFHLEEGYW